MKTQRTYGTPLNGPMYALRETQKEKRKKGTESLFEEVIEFLNSGEENGHTDSRSPVEPNQDKLKEIDSETSYIQSDKNKR